jgi:putative methionine-R-sulfoxide reductase with GAF domain
MVQAADALWDALAPTGISWIGFYLKDPAADQLILGPRRDKPACSPIALHGMCGRCFLEKRPIIIQDVALLGTNYIACDPRDRSEVVIPLLSTDGSCWGVLDADSYNTRAFGLADAAAMTEFVEAIGLSAPPALRRPPIIL